ncbi:glutamate receptor 1-like [Toxorhynchites rutilus septentrionalis]|uniref:glutamate receptor 1-like n=1 Tax=Toxorhynchites rutilus septentrionalis TaxID=329112 RepID=UPI00247AD625|nr:glutamate receptor 1-like [Toxorhynchites rutilus septentrionalis]
MPYFSTVTLRLKKSSQISITNNPLLAGIELGCNVFIVHQDSIINFMDRFIEFHDDATYRNPDKTVIMLMDGMQSNEKNLLAELCEHSNLVEIMNLLILKPTANMESIDLLTHRFVGTIEESVELILLDVFDVDNKTFRYGQVLFPDKISNMLGKSVRLATVNFPPLVILRKSESGNPLVRAGNQIYEMSGNDGLLVVEFCRRYNCTVELIIDDANMWGTIEKNKTGNGILGNLAKRRADVGIGGMNQWYKQLEFLSFSKPTQRGSVTCLVPRPGLQPAWKVMLIAFSIPVWCSTVAVLFIILFMHHLMDQLNPSDPDQQSFIRICLNLWAILLQQTAYIRRRNVSDVILSMALLMFTFNLINIYSSRNASLSTVPLFGPSIDTIYDLAKSGFTLLQTHEAWVFSLRMSENPTIKKLVSKFQAQPPAVLRELADKGYVALIIGRMNNGHLMLGDWITRENVHSYQLIKDDLYYDYEISMATKTWPLMEQFNTLTIRTTEALIGYYQELNAIYESSDYHVQTTAINSRLRESNATGALNLSGMFGVFAILGLGLFAATIIFIMEITPVQSKSGIHWHIGKKIYLWQSSCGGLEK